MVKEATQGTSKVTHDQLIKAVSGDTYRTLQSIGDEFGVTRERVRQLLNKHDLVNVPARKKPDLRKKCTFCSVPVNVKRYESGGISYPTAHELCRRAYKSTLWTTQPCTWCGEDIKLRKTSSRLSRRTRDWLFCNYSCSASYRTNKLGMGWKAYHQLKQ